MGERIAEPNIYLFAFHLTHGFNATHNAGDLDLFKHRCLEILQKFQVNSLPDLHAPTDYSIPIEGEVCLEENPNDEDIQPLIVRGFVHPLDLPDCYAFGLNIGCPEPKPSDKYQDIDITQLEKFYPNCFFPDFVKSSLGQTLLITVKLTRSQKQKGKQFIRNLADECVQNFIPSAYSKNLRLDRDGELFGSPIFEYGNPNHPESYIHVIVWLFSNPETENKFGECYQDFLLLFLYRNKIIQSYKNSRDVKIVIADDYQKIEQQINDINQLSCEQKLSQEELRKLKIQLKELPKIALEYAQMLRDLEDYRHTIVLNNQNYLDNINRIRERIKLNSQDALTNQLMFLTQFSEKNSRYFQEQIQAKLGYFGHGSGLLDKAIASIRGIVEIEQAESDRQLQNTIAIVGVGIGFAGVAATASPYIIPANPNQKFTIMPVHLQPAVGINPPHQLTLSLLFSLGAGLVGVAIASLTLRYIQSHPKSAIAGTVRLILGSSQNPEVAIPQQLEQVRSHPPTP